jgi:hypothetical protein
LSLTVSTDAESEPPDRNTTTDWTPALPATLSDWNVWLLMSTS